MDDKSRLRVMVLAGGPDRERPVSLKSGAAVAQALREAGHDVRQADIMPDDLAPLDDFAAWRGHVIFPVLHGRWGEGGPLQTILDQRRLPYVGSTAPAAALCMDKAATKTRLAAASLPTPDAETLTPGQLATLAPPVVVKAVDEGSSIGLEICHTAEQRDHAVTTLHRQYDRLLVERYVRGSEITVGLVEHDGRLCDLPPIQIVPASAYYDYDAKYQRNDTQYRFDIDLPAANLARLRELACETAAAVGVRHLARVDFLVDPEQRPWILEVNTIPGFTDHSLLPMAAARAGLPMAKLVDRLVRAAAGVAAGSPSAGG